MKHVLVTGGAGFIGSSFIRYFLEAHPEDRVTNLDVLTYAGNLKNLASVERDPRYRFVRGDISDGDLVAKLMKEADCAVNFAAETHVDRSIKDPGAFIRTNYTGVYLLLERARETRLNRFLQISTDEVYGSTHSGSFNEDSPLRPNSPYSAAKAAADLLIRAYHVTYKMPLLVVRSCNNYGPYQFPEKVIPLFITNLMAGEKVPLYAQGENIRDWIYVEDNCRAIDLVLEKGAAGEVYNIPADCEFSNLELTRAILKAFSKGDEYIRHVADRPGHDFRYSIDGAKIRELGFSPKYGFEEGLARTIEWYRTHEDWWRPLKKDEFTKK
jgi:dTDP-glucose 4,6-dehydratase